MCGVAVPPRLWEMFLPLPKKKTRRRRPASDASCSLKFKSFRRAVSPNKTNFYFPHEQGRRKGIEKRHTNHKTSRQDHGQDSRKKRRNHKDIKTQDRTIGVRYGKERDGYGDRRNRHIGKQTSNNQALFKIDVLPARGMDFKYKHYYNKSAIYEMLLTL